MAYPNVDFLYLSEQDMIEAGVTDVIKCTECMTEVVKILDEGDYRMGGENGNSHGCQILFPDEPAFPNMPIGSFASKSVTRGISPKNVRRSVILTGLLPSIISSP